MMGLNKSIILQGEIWKCNFDPQVGSEIAKSRPAIVISSDKIASFDTKIVVPLTTWRDKFEGVPFMVRIEPNLENGLSNPSAANCLQIKSFDRLRFVRKLGTIDRETHLTISLILFSSIKPF
ncbi:type II toxin-antitoxin system PemK/MazF family toxin [Helicobacter magdeburgensis]|uniref:mRNA interferase n=1 Tax=Helicobacter magdeburgensis TaxID=471858 RepID=A0A4U8T1Z9_9HELI|nr:type II toxin-antitoxin system PemK/MazF family toxin [Helicobacter magdeburgensis]TLD93470.1 type II toxin-antitoxin system PemK/MazF family toxin [Helicobacter magdeburgensis]